MLFMVTLPLFAFWACSEKEFDEVTYEANVPVYMGFEEFRSSFKKGDSRGIEYPGKIYFKDDYLFINEVNKGVHVIDNTDPSNPVAVAFYEIPGNVDMAIRGNILFADSYIDLVAIDISRVLQPEEIGRLKNAFPNVLPPVKGYLPMAPVDRDLGVVVGWKEDVVTERVPKGTFWRGHFWKWGMERTFTADMTFSGGGESIGVAGSMARFMLYDHYLYAVTNPHVLRTIDVSSPLQMAAIDSITTWREMETLFRHKEHLFIGTTTGMLIYSLSTPARPEFVSNFDHVQACDPVVVANDIAYVTLRTGNACFGASNQLDVIDIIDIKNPRLLKSYPMFNPHGLGIDHPILFICDGADGLKVYDATNPLAIASNMLAHFRQIDTYDVIPLGDVLLMIGHDGLFQYDYSDPTDIRLLSHLQITGKRE